MSDKKLETLILASTLYNEEYRRKVLPRTKEEYFQNDDIQRMQGIISQYFDQYNAMPTAEAVEVEIDNSQNLSEDLHKDLHSLREEIFSEKYVEAANKVTLDWIVDKTEKYFRQRAITNAIYKSIDILDGTDKKRTEGAIPGMMEEALQVSFDDGNFHDYFQAAENRYDYFHQPMARIPFKLKMLNYITKGGLLRKTLNLFVGPTGAGKTMFMCDESQHWLMEGYNVLYISLEMAEELISQRIDANLMDLEIDDTTGIPKKTFLNKIEKLRAKTTGKLIVKEFPPGTMTAGDLSLLLEDLERKHAFVPDVVVLDYINLASSMRYKSSDVNSYTAVKSVAEEFRGCAIRKDFCLVTATQTNRSGQTNSDYTLEEVSESHGLSMTADFMIGGIVTEELEKLGQMRLKQLKNRYGGLQPSSFIVGIERSKMKMFDVDAPSAGMDGAMKKRASDAAEKLLPRDGQGLNTERKAKLKV